ncbi:MAG: hypothetical protein K2H60_13810 [Muribaculaceae bacterium]|nr:hypothetical protein [Muribaculaceae bacterium]
MVNDDNTHYGMAFKVGRKANKKAQAIIAEIAPPKLSKLQKQNIIELANALGIPEADINPMSYVDADQGASNPTKDQDNCQSCVVSYIARRRGLDCCAKGYDETNHTMFELGEKFQNAWLDAKTGKILSPVIIRGKNDEEIILKLKRTLSQEGEYIVGFNGIDKDSGHVINVTNFNGQIIIHDEQICKEADRYSDFTSFDDIDYCEIIKIDKAILNINVAKEVLTKR